MYLAFTGRLEEAILDRNATLILPERARNRSNRERDLIRYQQCGLRTKGARPVLDIFPKQAIVVRSGPPGSDWADP